MTGSSQYSPTAERVWQRFSDAFGSSDGAALCYAPGRLNLIGAHLDYSGGDVLPLAVHLGVYVAIRLREDGGARMMSLNQGDTVEWAVDDLGVTAVEGQSWARYPLGVVRKLIDLDPGFARGFDAVFGGDLPIASGLSSSAAIEVVTAFALARLHDVSLEPLELARLAHRAETEFVGLKCGIMDQFASALGRDGHALLLHCFDHSYEFVPVDSTRFELLVVDTRKPRNLSATEFNRRVEECRRAFETLCAECGPRDCLAAFDSASLEAVQGTMDPILMRRARHVVSEMKRIRGAVKSLRDGDIVGFGESVTASHESTRVDYEVSCEELDLIVTSASNHQHAYGARLTGAGFGGCAFAIVDPAHTKSVESQIRKDFTRRFGIDPGFAVLRAGGGPARLR